MANPILRPTGALYERIRWGLTGHMIRYLPVGTPLSEIRTAQELLEQSLRDRVEVHRFPIIDPIGRLRLCRLKLYGAYTERRIAAAYLDALPVNDRLQAAFESCEFADDDPFAGTQKLIVLGEKVSERTGLHLAFAWRGGCLVEELPV